MTLSWRYFQRKSKRQHNNDSLTADRLKRDVKSMVTISALSEVNVGSYLISTYLFLYRSLFLSTILFNSQKWSNLRAQDIKALTTMQLKFIKRIVGVNSSTVGNRSDQLVFFSATETTSCLSIICKNSKNQSAFY